MDTKLNFSTAFHPQTDGQSKRTIKILEDMLRGVVLDGNTSWGNVLPLVEFAYNNSYQATIKMAPYEALYGRKCRLPLYWDEDGKRKILGAELVQTTIEIVDRIRARMKDAQDKRKAYADKRKTDMQFQVGDKVFLNIFLTRDVVRFGKRGKLRPRFIRPFEILEKISEVAYKLALSSDLSHVHDVYHVSMLRKYVFDPERVIKNN